ncbi:MAG TPA: YdcF family protein, partial [Candidatus Limnocylindria bacterium]|nr:YdcF family protein [Candidatus Limnocylindria bacterium]
MNATIPITGCLDISQPQRISSRHSHATARGLALFLGCLFLVAFIAQFVNPAVDLTIWWLDLRALPPASVRVLDVVAGISFLAWGSLRKPTVTLSWLVAAVATLSTMVALVNGVVVVGLFLTGKVEGGFPFPLSFLIALAFGAIARVACLPRLQCGGRPAEIFATAIACLGLFPVFQAYCLGWTNYQRPADVAVVFGARAYADGKPSEALADRVRRACDLYRDGTVKTLYFSGGPGDGAVHETESMRRMAIGLGVPATAIVADLSGLNTEATVRHSLDYAQSIHASRLLAVSEFYHLPRIKLCYQFHGAEILTVPAIPQNSQRAWPFFSVGREIPAF